MKRKIFLSATLLSIFAITSCGSKNYTKVLSVSYKSSSGSTVQSFSSSTIENRIKIGGYRFDSQSQYADRINGFYNTWYVCFSYQYDIVRKTSINEPVLQNEVTVNLMTGATQTSTTRMLLQTDIGIYTSYDEAFVDLGNLNSKYISYKYKEVQNPSGSRFVYLTMYEPIQDAQSLRYFNFYRSSDYGYFTMQQSSLVYTQSTVESYFVMPSQNDSIYMTYTTFPKA